MTELALGREAGRARGPERDGGQRLAREAEFQNRRIREGKRRVEDRARFYTLADQAFADYHASLGDVAGKHVLVVGCSDGGVTPLAHRGAFVTGIDIAEEAIAELASAIEREGLTGRARARVMNAEEIAAEDGSFDLICCSGVLHHLDVGKALACWARALKPEGRVAMIEPLAYHPAVALYRSATPSMRTEDEHPLRRRDFAAMRAHFRDVEMRPYVLTSMLRLAVDPVIGPARGAYVQRALERVDRSLMGWLRPLRYLAWTAVIELGGPRRTALCSSGRALPPAPSARSH